jgi:hypothetical protein
VGRGFESLQARQGNQGVRLTGLAPSCFVGNILSNICDKVASFWAIRFVSISRNDATPYAAGGLPLYPR